VKESQTSELVLVDLMLHGTSGLELLRKLKARRPETEVVMMTGHGTIESAVEAMKCGAYDYLIKPFTLGQLKLLLDRI
jgi:DNA-binding NtrC family response regulator